MVYSSPVWKNLSPVQKAENDLSKKQVFASVTGPFNPNGTKLTTTQLSSLYAQLCPPGKLPASEPAGTPVPPQQYDLYRSLAQFVSPNGKTVQFYTSLTAGSSSSTAALNAIPGVRNAVTSVQHASGATDSGAAGLAPASYDVSTVSQSDLEEIVPIVIVLLALLLGLLLRSLVAPLYLVATVLLSYFAALGIAVLIIQVGAGESGLNFEERSGPAAASLALAVAAGCAGQCGQRVCWVLSWAVRCLDGETLPDPVLESANHLFDLVSEMGQRTGGAGGAITAGPPAIGDHRDRTVQQLAGASRNVGGRQVHRSRYVPLPPGLLAARVEQHETGLPRGK
jgi:MMPL family